VTKTCLDNHIALMRTKQVDPSDKRGATEGETGWNEIDWKSDIKEVESKQEKIVIAALRNEMRKVYRLQRELVLSFAARALSVRKVISNKGGKTAGVDKVIWKGGEQYLKAVKQLLENVQNPQRYKAQRYEGWKFLSRVPQKRGNWEFQPWWIERYKRFIFWQ